MAATHGGSIVGEHLAKHNVSFIFNLCGGHISPLLVGADEHGVKVIDVRDEKNAVFAADAVARMTGIPGVAAVTAGPGVTNTITAVKNAQMAEIPLIIFGGATATVLKGRGSLQDIEQEPIMASCTKWCARVTKVSALGPTIDKAFEIATSGVPGPVFIEVPVDLLYQEEIVREWYMAESGVEKMSGVTGKALELYLKAHLTRLFKAPHVHVDTLPAGVSLEQLAKSGPIGPSLEEQLEKTADAYIRAEKPMLVIGSQALVNFDPDRAAELAEAVETLGMPTFLGGTARGLLGANSDIQFRHKRTASMKKSDYVIVAGFPFDFRMGYGQKINRKATLISANLDPKQLRKNRTPDIGAMMHPGDFIIALARKVEGKRPRWTSWFEEVRGREEARDAEIVAMQTEPDELVNPVNFFMEMDKVLDDDSILVVDGGDFVATAAYILKPRKRLSWLDPGVFGTLGVGGGFTLGASMARPDAEVWLIWGDGSSAYSLAEFDTFVRYGLAPIAVIGSDASWGQIARDQVEILGTALSTELRLTEYHKVAEGYGGVGILVTKQSQVPKALKKAKKLAKEGKPVCINIHLEKSDFRKGSISM